ncbi:MAG: nitroreductase family protein [Cyanobacteriota bacterium]|nr:nitroreductase family protein [Cyanobacteriota bacterium]MDY6364855.1 nitroreductase family protein [Cyanobacteriota bacterium]
MSFLDFAKERFSCRKFSDKPVESEKVDKIIEACLAAPTAVNFQPFKIFIFNSEKSIEKVAKATPYTFGAKLIFAVGADSKNSFVRKFDNKNGAEIDAAIVGTHLMLEVHDLGLGTTWVGYFNPNVLKEEFPQLKDYDIVGLYPVGYPADDAVPSPMHSKSKTKEELVQVL